MFIYTKNENLIKLLESNGSKLINVRGDGIRVYAPSPSLKINFTEHQDTYVSNKLTL